MAENIVDLNWKGEMAFNAEVNGHIVSLDADEMVGGKDSGARPKQLLLAALAGCTAMDVVSILSKMRIHIDDLNINVNGNLTNDHPKVYDKIHLIYSFKGKELPLDKLQKAINLSLDKYCGVTAMLNKVADITHEIIIE